MAARGMARQRSGHRRLRGHAVSDVAVRAPGPGQCQRRCRAGLRQRAPGQRPGLFGQLFPAAARRPGPGGDGVLPAAGHGREPVRLPDRHLFAQRHPGPTGGSATHAQPGGGLHRSRRHPAGVARVGPARQSGLHVAAAARPAGQHHGAAHGQLARRPRPVSRMCSRPWSPPCRSPWSRCWCCWARTCGCGCVPSRTWPTRWPSARPWRIRWSPACGRATCAGRITYVNPAFCQMVGFTAEELLGHGTPAPYWPPELADQYNKRQASAPGRPSGPAARGLRVGVHAQGRLAFSGAHHRGAADQRARRADRLDERLPGHQRAAARGGNVARQPGAAAGHGAAGHGGRDGVAAEPRAEPAAGRDFQLRQRFDQPAEGQGRGASDGAADVPLADIEVAMRRISEQAERAGKVIKSVHDFVRRRDKEREPVTPAGAAGRDHAAGQPAGPQARACGCRSRSSTGCRRCCATGRWSSRCCSTWRAMPCRPWTRRR